jgi:hypothetical protein
MRRENGGRAPHGRPRTTLPRAAVPSIARASLPRPRFFLNLSKHIVFIA